MTDGSTIKLATDSGLVGSAAAQRPPSLTLICLAYDWCNALFWDGEGWGTIPAPYKHGSAQGMGHN